MYDCELLCFLDQNKIFYSEIDEKNYDMYSSMSKFPFTGSRINWKNLKNHIYHDFNNIFKFFDEVEKFIYQDDNLKLILIGYDFEQGYLLKLSAINFKKLIFFLAEYPGENYLIDVDENWCICIYDSLDFGML